MLLFDYIPCPQLECRHGVHTIDELAYSMCAKMCQYYLHSTNRNSSSDQQSGVTLRLDSKMSEKIGKRNTAKRNDLESEKNIIRVNCFWGKNYIDVTASLRRRSVAFATSIFENGTKEFRTDGIIHCWNSPSTTLKPITTSRILFRRKRFRILFVRGKFSS